MTKEEYEARFKANEKVEGHGIVGMTVHVPCMFCAAPDFFVYTLPTMERVMAEGATCKECGRGARAVIVKTPSCTQMSFVQTGGDDPPDYIPWIRREAAHPSAAPHHNTD